MSILSRPLDSGSSALGEPDRAYVWHGCIITGGPISPPPRVLVPLVCGVVFPFLVWAMYPSCVVRFSPLVVIVVVPSSNSWVGIWFVDALGQDCTLNKHVCRLGRH